jgi:hypothetical protein
MDIVETLLGNTAVTEWLKPVADKPLRPVPFVSRFQLDDMVRAPGIKGAQPVTGICFRAGAVTYEVGGVFHDSAFVHEPMRAIVTPNVELSGARSASVLNVKLGERNA